MIGIDSVEVARFDKLLTNSTFLNKHFSEYEKQYILKKGVNANQTMAGLFAAKEAVLKCLGLGMCGELTLKDIKIVHIQSGKPVIEWNDKLKKYTKSVDISNIDISITHTKYTATAICMAK